MLLVEGPRVLAEAHAAGVTIYDLLHTPDVLDDPVTRSLVETVAATGASVEAVAPADLAGFATTVNPAGIVAAAALPRSELSDVAGGRLLVLDAVQDPGNVGTLARTAEVLGAHAVVVLPGTADPWSPKVTRAAAGATFRLPIVRADLGSLGLWCDERGVPMFAAASDGEPARRDGEPIDVALILGNEAAGVSPAVREACERSVAIPQRGRTESLNVAVAGAILMDRYFGG